MPSRSLIVLSLLLAALIAGWLVWRNASSLPQRGKTPAPTINKQPETFASRTFDPASPPTDMPPLNPGENAECDSDFVSYASVGAQARQTDATHETVTITQVNVTLELHITIWVPTTVTQHVTDHEEGHRQISQFYYQNAGQLAQRIATTYMGKQVVVSGADLPAEFSKTLQQMSADITDEYGKELNPEPAQLRYDAITDHSRNDVVAKDAVAQALSSENTTSSLPQSQ